MTELLELYKCEVCGNIVQIMHSGVGELVCCGAKMKKLKEQTINEEMQEKHVPVFIQENKIQVGSVPHPMTKEHYIEFIQSYSTDKKYIETKFLSPEEKPETELQKEYKNAREYCNIHGLWVGQKE